MALSFFAVTDPFAALRTSTCTIAGKTVPCDTRIERKRSPEFLPDGAANAADPGERIFCIAASGSAPTIGSAVVYHGESYTVSRVEAEDFNGRQIAWRLFCYRTPPADGATVDSVTGKREDYTAPDATF